MRKSKYLRQAEKIKQKLKGEAWFNQADLFGSHAAMLISPAQTIDIKKLAHSFKIIYKVHLHDTEAKAK